MRQNRGLAWTRRVLRLVPVVLAIALGVGSAAGQSGTVATLNQEFLELVRLPRTACHVVDVEGERMSSALLQAAEQALERFLEGYGIHCGAGSRGIFLFAPEMAIG